MKNYEIGIILTENNNVLIFGVFLDVGFYGFKYDIENKKFSIKENKHTDYVKILYDL